MVLVNVNNVDQASHSRSIRDYGSAMKRVKKDKEGFYVTISQLPKEIRFNALRSTVRIVVGKEAA